MPGKPGTRNPPRSRRGQVVVGRVGGVVRPAGGGRRPSGRDVGVRGVVVAVVRLVGGSRPVPEVDAEVELIDDVARVDVRRGDVLRLVLLPPEQRHRSRLSCANDSRVAAGGPEPAVGARRPGKPLHLVETCVLDALDHELGDPVTAGERTGSRGSRFTTETWISPRYPASTVPGAFTRLTPWRTASPERGWTNAA